MAFINLSLRRSLAVTAIAALVTACGDGSTATDGPTAPAALSVMTQAVRYTDQLVRRETLTGRVEANRSSDVGFELPGELVDVVVDEGDRLARGAVLARLSTARLDARRNEIDAALQQATAQAALARSTLDRVREALTFQGVSQQEVDEAQNALATANASVAASRSRLASVDVDLQKSILRAPYDAVITARHADEGQVMRAGQPVLSLQEADSLLVRVGVAGEALSSLIPGIVQTVSINGQDIEANVRQVLPQRDRVARTVDVLLELPPGVDARAGDLARIDVREQRDTRGVWLPIEALAEGRRGLWTVYVAAPETNSSLGATHQVTPRPVDIIHQDGDRALVRGPLEDGEQVIVSGLQRIVPGQFVRIDTTVAKP